MKLPMKKQLAIAVSIMLIAACSEERIESPEEEAIQEQPELILTSGIDREGMNHDVRPQDDFYEYANGSWLAAAEIPPEEVGWGSYMTLNKESLEQSRKIVVELAEGGSKTQEEGQIGSYYNAWVNEELVEDLGINPLKGDLAEIEALSSHDDVAAHFGKVNPMGVGGPFNFYVDRDYKDSTQYVVMFMQTGLGLPDRDYYFDESERGQHLRSEYQNYVTKLLKLSGYGDAENAAARVVELETKLAEHQWDKVDNRDRSKRYNPYSDKEFSELLSSFNLDEYLKGIGVEGQPHVVVFQPSYFEALNDIFRKVEVETWKEYLRVRLLTSFANFLNQEFVDARFDFYSRTLYGREEQQPRWRRAVSSINGNLGELLGKIYVERYFAEESKERMVELVDNLIEAYRISINELEWMSDETKEKALEKLSKFTPKIGYPNKWKDYSNLEIKADDLVGNIKRSRSWGHYDDVGKLGQPIDKEEWLMPPQIVNAYYYPTGNEIVFPAAYLQPPNFIPTAEDAYNYGAIGTTIGHEIGHGFDDQGSKYDGDGNLISWWTEEDRANFEQRTKGLIEQYNSYEVLPDLFINGELTLGENIGDLGGVAIALKAYRLSLKGKEPPVIDGFTAEERFFLGYAQSNRLLWRDEFLETLVKTDPHAPDKFRVNGVYRNVDDFYQAYELKQGDGLYLPDEERISIWQ